MNCKNCGAEIVDGQKFCSNCGARVEISLIHNAVAKADNILDENVENNASENVDNKNLETEASTSNVATETQINVEKTNTLEKSEIKKTNCGYGIASMVLGIVAFFMNTYSFFTLILGVLGLIFSCISFSKFKSGKYKNKGFHIAGLVLSIIVLAFFLIGLCFTIIESIYLISLIDSTTTAITSGVII